MHELTGFQFFQINNGDSKLGSAMTGGGIAGFGRDDDRFGALAAETIPQDGKFIERLGLDVAGLAAEEQRDDPAGGHDVDLVQNAAVSQHIIPPNHGTADHIMENRGIHAGLVGIQLEHAAHIAQPCPGMHIPETERYLLVGNDRQILNETDPFHLLQGIFVGRVAGAALSLHGVAARNVQRWDLAVLRRRDPLNIGDDRGPLASKPEKTGEKRIKIREILRQDMIIHPPGEQRSAGHQEKVLDGIGQITVQIIRKIRARDVVKAVFLAGVGEGGHILPGGEHTCRKQRGITAAGDIYGAVRVFFFDGEQLAQDAVRLKQTGSHKDQFGFPAAFPIKSRQLLLPRVIPEHLTGTEIDNAPRVKHIRCQNVFNGAFVV